MTKISVVDERLDQVETLQKRLAEVARRAKEHPELLPAINAGLQDVIDGKTLFVSAVHPAGSDDPFAAYRRVKGLIFIGPKAWTKAIRDRKDSNPLNINYGSCLKPPIIVNGRQFSVDHARELVRLCQTSEWDTTPILWLALPNVENDSTSIVKQYCWWGVQHDGFGPGDIRQDVFWSNWYLGRDDCAWKDEPAVTEPTWMIGYEHPQWTASKNWSRQQAVATERKMVISTVTQDVLMLNLVLAATGKRLRLSTWSRTCTMCDGSPLDVFSSAHGVFVSRYWDPGHASPGIALSVQGVSLGL